MIYLAGRGRGAQGGARFSALEVAGNGCHKRIEKNLTEVLRGPIPFDSLGESPDGKQQSGRVDRKQASSKKISLQGSKRFEE